MLGYDKAASRQAGTLYGQQGVMVQQWSDDLKEPGTQAVVIVVASVLMAGGCLYMAKLVENVGEQADKHHTNSHG